MDAKPVFVLAIFVALTAASGLAQDATQQASNATLPDAPSIQQQMLSGTSSSSSNTPPSYDAEPNGHAIPPSQRQPKRILGIMPNYRAVSAGKKPPPTLKEDLKVATYNSFDYSAFVFVGLTSGIAEETDTHPQLGKGIPGFWAIHGADSSIRPMATTR